MNRVHKGNRRELEARKMLEADGFLVDKKPRTKYQSPDLFGTFDLIALKGSPVRFIQVKSNKSDFYKARKEVRSWMCLNNCTLPCEVWLKENNKPWRNEIIKPK